MMRMSRARASSPSARSMTARSPLSRAGEWAASSVTAPCTARSRSTAAATLWRISVPCCSSRWRSAPVDCHRRRPTKPRMGRMKAAQSAARCHSTGQAPRKAGRRELAASGGAVGPTMGMALSALIDAPQDPDAVSRALVRRPGAEGRANAAKVRTDVPRLARVRTAGCGGGAPARRAVPPRKPAHGSDDEHRRATRSAVRSACSTNVAGRLRRHVPRSRQTCSPGIAKVAIVLYALGPAHEAGSSIHATAQGGVS
jgi:hypothetical protein